MGPVQPGLRGRAYFTVGRVAKACALTQLGASLFSRLGARALLPFLNAQGPPLGYHAHRSPAATAAPKGPLKPALSRSSVPARTLRAGLLASIWYMNSQALTSRQMVSAGHSGRPLGLIRSWDWSRLPREVSFNPAVAGCETGGSFLLPGPGRDPC